MSAEGRALIMRMHPRRSVTSAAVFDALASLEADMVRAVNGGAVMVSEWESWLRKSPGNREALVRVLFLLIAAGGVSSADVHRLRKELANVSPQRQRAARLIQEPRERKTRGLF